MSSDRRWLCCSQGCESNRMIDRIWCKKHDTCELCEAQAVEGRGAGKPRCAKHSEVGPVSHEPR